MSKRRPKAAGAQRTPPRPRLRLSDSQLVWILLGVGLLLALLLFDPKLAPAGDNAQYIILAQSILKGTYRNLHEPGTPLHVLYPPGFPVLLTPFLALSGKSFVPMKFLIVLCFMGSVLFTALLLKRFVRDQSWVLPALLVATCPLLLEYSHETFSEMPFLLFSLMTVFVFTRALAAKRRRLLWFAGAALALGATYYVRSQGLFLIMAVGLVLLLRRMWQELVLVAVIVGVIALPWFLRNLHISHSGYLPWLLTKDPYNIDAGKLTMADMAKRFVANLRLYVLRVYPLIVVPVLGRNRFLLGTIGVAALGCTAVGFVQEAKRRRLGTSEWYTLLTVAIVLVWPAVWSGDRFLLPVVPFLLYYLYRGLSDLGRWIKFRQLGIATAGLLVILFGVNTAGRAASNLTNLSGYMKGDEFAGCDEAWRTYLQAAQSLRTSTDTSAIVVSRKPQFTYLYSGRKSFVFPYTSDENKVLRAIDSVGATHVFLESFFGQSVEYLYPVIRDHPARFEQLGLFGSRDYEVYVFRVKR